MKKADSLALRVSEIEKAFVQVTIDLKRVLIFDGVDQLEACPELRIDSHDFHGPLPGILIHNLEDRYAILDYVTTETAKLCVISRVRSNLASMFPGCRFLLPTRTDEGSLVGMRFAGKTIFAEHENCWEAYHKLVEEAVRRIL